MGVDQSRIGTVVKGADWDAFAAMVSERRLDGTSSLLSSGEIRLSDIKSSFPYEWDIIKSEVFPALRAVTVEVKSTRRVKKQNNL